MNPPQPHKCSVCFISFMGRSKAKYVLKSFEQNGDWDFAPMFYYLKGVSFFGREFSEFLTI